MGLFIWQDGKGEGGFEFFAKVLESFFEASKAKTFFGLLGYSRVLWSVLLYALTCMRALSINIRT